MSSKDKSMDNGGKYKKLEVDEGSYTKGVAGVSEMTPLLPRKERLGRGERILVKGQEDLIRFL